MIIYAPPPHIPSPFVRRVCDGRPLVFILFYCPFPPPPIIDNAVNIYIYIYLGYTFNDDPSGVLSPCNTWQQQQRKKRKKKKKRACNILYYTYAYTRYIGRPGKKERKLLLVPTRRILLYGGQFRMRPGVPVRDGGLRSDKPGPGPRSSARPDLFGLRFDIYVRPAPADLCRTGSPRCPPSPAGLLCPTVTIHAYV